MWVCLTNGKYRCLRTVDAIYACLFERALTRLGPILQGIIAVTEVTETGNYIPIRT